MCKPIQVASIVTPVPGGVGPCTVACLMQNTLLGKDGTFGLSIKGTGSRDDYFLQAHKVESLIHVRLRNS